MSAAAALLGEDGRGYELARRLEGSGAWRAWLGDAAHAALANALASPAAWDSFLTSRATSQLPLQLRARALLFDKASAALSLPPSATLSLADINPAYFQFHGDDIYLPLEDVQDGVHHQTQTRPTYDRAPRVGLRYNEPENLNTSQRHMHDELPDAYGLRHQKYPLSDNETNKRTSEGMSAYLKLRDTHKRRRQLLDEKHILENVSGTPSRIVSDVNNSIGEDNLFFPEMMFPWSCVPDSALPPPNGTVENQKLECFEVLDNLPAVMSMSPAMIERFGITPEIVKTGTKYRGKDGSGGPRRSLSQEQATKMTLKVVARLLASIGFEAGAETSMEVLSEIITSHICKLGRTLKLLTDSYRKQFSAVDILKMFLQSTGHSNLGALADITKSTNRAFTHHSQQHVRALQSQNQTSHLQAQQLQRQVHPQLNIFHPQNLTIQQQQQLLWRRQATTPRGSQMVMDKDKPMAEVKMENTGESPMDGSFSALSKHQMQMRHPVMANQHMQPGQQLKQLPSVQVPQHQLQNTHNMRTQVKVEGFPEFGGGDSTLKRES